MSLPYPATSQTGLAPLSARLATWDDKTGVSLDTQKKPFVLLIEDNLGDVLLVEEALREHQIDCDLTVWMTVKKRSV